MPADDADVPRHVASLGLPGLIDVHMHVMPEQVLTQQGVAYFDAVGPLTGIEWPITCSP